VVIGEHGAAFPVVPWTQPPTTEDVLQPPALME
jgi:hypothetical protein